MDKIFLVNERTIGPGPKRISASCYCTAARAGNEIIAGELEELRRTVQRPDILCLENLDSGIPSCPGGWDLIYSIGLLTGLPDVAARQVVKAAFARLKPGGRLYFANLSVDASIVPCRRCLASGNNRRDEYDMAALTHSLPPDSIGGQAIFRDRAGLNVYLELHRNTVGLVEKASSPRFGQGLQDLPGALSKRKCCA